jgi:hypothetical protein
MKSTLPSLKSPLPTGWSLHLHDNFAHLCVVESHLSQAIAQSLVDALLDLKVQGFRRILLEENVQRWNLATSDVLSLLQSLRPYDFFDMRVALLSPYRAHLDDLRFLETASVNRGYEMRVFLEVGPGLAWLLEVAKSDPLNN